MTRKFHKEERTNRHTRLNTNPVLYACVEHITKKNIKYNSNYKIYVNVCNTSKNEMGKSTTY